MFPHSSRAAAVASASSFGPQFRGSVLYRPLRFGRMRAITFWPWGLSDVPLSQLRREHEHEIAVAASEELNIRPALLAILRRAGVPFHPKAGE